MKTYSVYLAPAIKTEKGICANGAKHWERFGTIESKNKKTALTWLKKNKDLGKEFVYVLMQPYTTDEYLEKQQQTIIRHE